MQVYILRFWGFFVFSFVSTSRKNTIYNFYTEKGILYTTYTQFKNPKALELYKLSEGVENEIENQKATLKKLRQEYSVASPEQREKLAPSILKAEEYLKTLYPQPEQYRNAARAEEIK